MQAPRRFLPPLNWLLAAEAVAREGSVSSAARDLSLTQSAVSRQIQNLEDQLGFQLFRRERKRLHVTPEGAEYLREAVDALYKIANAGIRATSNPGGGVLELAVLPGFGTHWLAPRLPDFLSAHPGVTLNLTTRLRPFDFGSEPFHGAISFGAPDWQGAEYEKLMDERVVPVASPEFVAENGIKTPEDLLHTSLLRLQSRPRAWSRWMRAYGLDVEPKGMVFDQFAPMAQAAAYGLGVALLPDYMTGDALAAGTLSVVAGATEKSVGAYSLIWPKGGGSHPPLLAFKQWILEKSRAGSEN